MSENGAVSETYTTEAPSTESRYAVAVCQEAGARQLALFHHAPERTDAEIDTILASTRRLVAANAPDLDVVAAYEGLEMNLGHGAPSSADLRPTKLTAGGSDPVRGLRGK